MVSIYAPEKRGLPPFYFLEITKPPGLARGYSWQSYVKPKAKSPYFCLTTDHPTRRWVDPVRLLESDQVFASEFRDGFIVDTSVNVLEGDIGTLGERITEVQSENDWKVGFTLSLSVINSQVRI